MCARAPELPGAAGLPYGADISAVLSCLDRLYDGPDWPPLDGMLRAAVTGLVRRYPGLQLGVEGGKLVVSGAKERVALAPAADVDALADDVVRLAVFARAQLPEEAIADFGSPEHVLLAAAFHGLALRTWITPAPGEAAVDDSTTPPYVGAVPDGPTIIRPDGIAYLNVGSLRPGRADELRRFLSGENAVRGVILDLRGSAGGLLTEAVDLMDLFLEGGCLAVVRGVRVDVKVAFWQPDDVELPLAVLVDHGTSSGAELVAATLRARDRAAIVGERTFGDGVVTIHVKLRTGATLSVPIAELLAADGSAFHGHGVEADLPVPNEVTDKDTAIEYAARLLLAAKGRSRRDLLEAAAR